MERIESERLYLRPFGHGDAEAVWAYRSLAEVARYQYWEPYTPEDARSFIERYAGQVPGEDQTWTGLAVVLKATGTVIGDCAFYLDGDRAEIGCNISPAYQRRGLAREALQTLVAYCAEVYKVALIRGITDSRKLSSIRLQESLGMVRDRTFENRIQCKGGNLHRISVRGRLPRYFFSGTNNHLSNWNRISSEATTSRKCP